MQNVIKSFIFHLLAISTPLILTSCSNSGSETPDNNINKIQLSNKYNDSSKTNIVNNIKDGTLSLSTIVNVQTGTSIESIVNALKEDKKSKENFIILLNNSEATHNGFSSGENKISYSDIIIQSFLSNDIKISAEKLTSPANSISVTVTNSNKSWDIEGLNNIKFTLTIVEKTNANEKLVKLFSDNNEANKLVASDSTSNSIILTNKLNPDYEFSTSNNNDLNGIGHKSVDEIKKWLNGTADANSDVLAKDKLLELVYKNVFLENFINKKPTPSEQGKADKNDDITVLKTNILPHGILTSNTKATFTVTEDSTEQNTNSFKSKTVTITFELIDGYKWVGLSTGLENHKIVFEFTIPVPSLEQITLFKEWNQSFVLNGDEFVFENKLDENYEPIAWKTSDEVKTWFKKTTSDAPTNYDAQEADLNEESFVQLFYEKAFLNNYFTNIQPESTKPDKGYNSTTEPLKLLRENIAPHEIDDKNITAKVKVEDITPVTGSYNSSVPVGSSKKITITLTPNKGYGWAAISNFAHKNKPIKFILNMDASDATLPINALLGAVKTYNSPDKGTQNLYWFKCDSNNNNQFDYSKAEESIQDLVSKSIFAGPSQDEKTKKASEVYADDFVKQDWTNKPGTESEKTKRLAYLKKGFDLSEEKNFNLFKELVLNQNFSNVYKEGEADKTDIYVAGASLWFSEYKQEIKNQLKQQINCDIMISTAEASEQTAKTNEEITYTVSFRLTPKNGGNWKGRDDNYPIDIDVIFNAPNLTSFVENKIDTFANQNESKKPAITTNGSNKTIDFVGEVDKSIFTGENIPTDAATIQSYFEKKDAPANRQKYTKAALASNKIDIDKFKQIKTNIKDSIKNGSGQDQYIIAKDNISFLYINDGKTITGQNTYFTKKTVNVKSLEAKDKDANNKIYTLEIILTLSDKQKSGWFWGGWDEITSSDKNAETRISDIKLSLDISLK